MTQTLSAETQLDVVVKKSLFRVQAAPIETEGDALAFFERIRDPNATHNCWAWRLGERYRSFDDGEPGGTAGRPILQAIDSQAFDRVIVVVTRWFGGIKLGAGGLVRAYGGATSSCLRQADILPIIPMRHMRFHASFSLVPIIQARAKQWGAHQENCVFDENGAMLTIAVPIEHSHQALEDLNELLRGKTISFLS